MNFAMHGVQLLIENLPKKLAGYVVGKTFIHCLGRSKQLAP